MTEFHVKTYEFLDSRRSNFVLRLQIGEVKFYSYSSFSGVAMKLLSKISTLLEFISIYF